MWLPKRLDRAFYNLGMGAGATNMKTLLAASIANPAYVVYFDDFLGQSAGTWPASANWGYPATQGVNTEVIGITATGANGLLTLTTAGASGDGAYQNVGRHWNGTRGFYMIAKANMTTITTAKFEIGMVDSITTAEAIATKATPTFNMTAGAVFCFDTNDDTNVTFITATGGVVGANADATNFTLVAGTDAIFEIIGAGGQATGYINGQMIGAGAITAATALTPYFGVTTRVAATRSLVMDYVGCIGPRS
jgi:hypothetical protein